VCEIQIETERDRVRETFRKEEEAVLFGKGKKGREK
jgi:hypothetical protein